jgi:hypothetical protein
MNFCRSAVYKQPNWYFPTEQISARRYASYFYSGDVWFEFQQKHRLFQLRPTWFSSFSAGYCRNNALSQATACFFQIFSKSLFTSFIQSRWKSTLQVAYFSPVFQSSFTCFIYITPNSVTNANTSHHHDQFLTKTATLLNIYEPQRHRGSYNTQDTFREILSV